MTSPQFISPTSLQSAEYNRSTFRLSLEKEFTKEDLLISSKWRQVARAHPILKAGDIIEVLREDMAFFATLLVTGKVNDEVFTKVINFISIDEEEESSGKQTDFQTSWKGPIKKFTIVRKSDKKELRDKFASKDEANFWLKNNY